MARRWTKKKNPPREEKQLKEKWKIESQVFDKDGLLTLSYFMNKKVIASLDYPIATGKEANVFRATSGEAYSDVAPYLAVKIYRIETSNFIRMQEYLTGDNRFIGVKNTRRNIIYSWTQKEFKNLGICEEAGVRAPKPYLFRKNVLVMEFLGEEGIPDSTLKQMGPTEPERECDTILGYIKKLYARGLVHADISEFNIMMHAGEPYLIDIGQGVLSSHPKAEEFLARDIYNVVDYFAHFGVKKDKEEVLKWVRG